MIVLLVLALRSLLPAGFMLQAAHADTGGAFEIVICTSAGPKVLTMDQDGPSRPGAPQHLDNGLCAFAAAGAAALASAEPTPLVREVAYAAVAYRLAVAQFAETPKPGAVSARGPPSQVI